MKKGDKIRVSNWYGHNDYKIEEFYHCLGYFETKDDRTAGRFTPLCILLEPGPDSETKYISNYGEYKTNLVQGWSDLPNDLKQ